MAGATNTVFRQICRDYGADVLTSEMVSAEGLQHINDRTKHYVEFAESERPFGIQLFGGSAERLAEAARFVAERVKPDFIDLNFGCPVRKVVAKNGGAGILRDARLMARVARAVVEAAAPLPVTAKIRTGWDCVNATENARILENCGIARLTVHGRTREQGYAGEADWNVIAEVVRTVKIPVVGNGDIRSGADALRAAGIAEGIAGIMIGRGALSGPWIFAEVRAALDTRLYTPPSWDERVAVILDHCNREVAWGGNERLAIHSLRARLMSYTHGMPGAAKMRVALARVESVEDVKLILQAN